MSIEIGRVEAVFQYPVKSMAGWRMESANIGWHGIDGDRRLALRRGRAQDGFPWLTATKLPELILFTPVRKEGGSEGDLPTHVRTPEGTEMEIFGEDLAAEIARRHKAPVQMMHLRDGIFDAAYISVITTDTMDEIGRLAGTDSDIRRFRPNIVVRSLRSGAFEEDKWLGCVLAFGEGSDGPRVSVTMRDERCAIINLHPDSSRSSPTILKSVVRANETNAGVYGTVIRTGRVAVGQLVRLHAENE